MVPIPHVASSIRPPLTGNLLAAAAGRIALGYRHRSSLLLPVLLFASGHHQRSVHVVASALSTRSTTHPRARAQPPLGAGGTSNMFRRAVDAIENSPRPRTPTPTMVHMDSGTVDGRPTKWDHSCNDAVGRCVPPLTSSSHKGSSGRVGVLGGSPRYTGAPYYAAMASLKVGADLAFVFCAQEAALPIKCYSPELMVTPVYDASEFDRSLALEKRMNEALAQSRVEGMEEIRKRSNNVAAAALDDDNKAQDDPFREALTDLETIREEQQRLVDDMVSSVTGTFDRLHVLIIGPGLGRCPLVLKATAKIIAAGRERNMPMVIDADGLFLLTQEPYANLVSGCKGLVLTPNAVEAKRMTQTMGANFEKLTDYEEDANGGGMSGFERATEGAVIVKKGSQDIIFSTVQETSFQDRDLHVKRTSMLCDEEGGLKRSGGLGDILSGCIGTFVAWNRIMSRENLGRNVNNDDLILACWSACCITKRATRHAFQKKRRAMTAPDVLEEIGETVDEMMGDSIAME